MKRSKLLIWMMIALTAACSGVKSTPEPTPIPPTEKPAEIYYSLTVFADPPGGGAVAPVEESLLSGMVVHVQAKAAPGYEFAGWSGAVSLTTTSFSLTMDGDKELTAHFTPLPTSTPLPPTLTATPEPTPTPEATEPGTCSLTQWCNDHVGCEAFEVKNQSNFAIGIFLKYTDTGDSCNYYVPPKGNLQIALRPGRYYYYFTTCGGAKVFEGYHHLSARWYWITKAQDCN